MVCGVRRTWKILLVPNGNQLNLRHSRHSTFRKSENYTLRDSDNLHPLFVNVKFILLTLNSAKASNLDILRLQFFSGTPPPRTTTPPLPTTRPGMKNVKWSHRNNITL